MKFGWAEFRCPKLSIVFSLIMFLLSGRSFAQQTAATNTAKDSSDKGANSAVAEQPHRTSREDLNSLSIADSDLHADPAFFGNKADYPVFTRELLQVQWRMADPIDLWVIRPVGVAKPPVVLFLYSYPSETDRFRDDRYCERVTKNGYAAVGFVSALTGHRYQNRPMKEWFVSELQESVVTSVHDVQMIINYLATRGDFDMNQVGMFGQGSGGTIAILAAAVDPRIKAVDALNPWADWPDWMAKSALIPENERPNYVKPEFQKKIAFFDPVLWLPKLTSQSVRIQDIASDTDTPEICKKELEEVAPASVEVAKFDDDKAHFRAMVGGKVFDWIKDRLRFVAEPKSGA